MAIAGAYNTVYNLRRLENPFYGVWDIILTAMISDLGPNAYIVPQFSLDGLTPNRTMASSITIPNADARIPDFAILADDFKYLPPDTNANIPQWHTISTVSRRCLVLVEGKRPPTRRPQNQMIFGRKLNEHLWNAYLDLKQQAAKVFQAHADTNQLILIAFSGVWWTWQIYTRQHLEEQVTDKDDLPESATSISDEYPGSNSDDNPGSNFCPSETEAQTEGEEKSKKTGKKKKGKGRAAHRSKKSKGPLRTSSQPGSCAPTTVITPSSSQLTTQTPAANMQGGDIGPSGATQLRRSNSKRQAPKRYQPHPDRPPPVRKVEELQLQVPPTRFPIQYYHSVDNMEPLHQDVDIALDTRTGTVSGPILVGSLVSNQALHIIHNWLEKEISKFVVHSANGDQGQQDTEGSLAESSSRNRSDSNTHNEVESFTETRVLERSEDDLEESGAEPASTEEESAVDSDGSERSWVLG